MPKSGREILGHRARSRRTPSSIQITLAVQMCCLQFLIVCLTSSWYNPVFSCCWMVSPWLQPVLPSSSSQWSQAGTSERTWAIVSSAAEGAPQQPIPQDSMGLIWVPHWVSLLPPTRLRTTLCPPLSNNFSTEHQCPYIPLLRTNAPHFSHWTPIPPCAPLSTSALFVLPMRTNAPPPLLCTPPCSLLSASVYSLSLLSINVSPFSTKNTNCFILLRIKTFFLPTDHQQSTRY